MNANIYPFKVGKFDCVVVNDGAYNYPQPGKLFFEDVPHDRLASALTGHNIDLDTWDVYVSPYPSLVIDTGEHRVLVDTGMGSMVPTTGNLIQNLIAAGFSPDEIDIVILSHAHPDHIGGNLDEAGCPAFPNARWVMGRSEWDVLERRSRPLGAARRSLHPHDVGQRKRQSAAHRAAAGLCRSG